MSVSENSTKVIGYCAIKSNDEVLCGQDACIVTGDSDSMNCYIHSTFSSFGAYSIKKIRFGDIMQGMALGLSYALDPKAYQRFLPLATQRGMRPRPHLPQTDTDNTPPFFVIHPDKDKFISF